MSRTSDDVPAVADMSPAELRAYAREAPLSDDTRAALLYFLDDDFREAVSDLVWLRAGRQET